MANPFPFASGDVLTAAELNSIGAWTSYTPTISYSAGGGSVVNGTLSGKYAEVNGLTFVQVKYIIGSSDTFGSGKMLISLPVATAALDPFTPIGWGYAIDGSTSYICVVDCSNTADKMGWRTSGSGFGDITAAAPFTFSSGDQFHASAVY